MIAIALGALAVWLFLCCDAYVVMNRKRNAVAKPVNPEDEHDLLYTSPRWWAERAIQLIEKERRNHEG